MHVCICVFHRLGGLSSPIFSNAKHVQANTNAPQAPRPPFRPGHQSPRNLAHCFPEPGAGALAGLPPSPRKSSWKIADSSFNLARASFMQRGSAGFSLQQPYFLFRPVLQNKNISTFVKITLSPLPLPRAGTPFHRGSHSEPATPLSSSYPPS